MDNSIVTDLYQSKWEKIIHQLDILYNEGRIDEEYNKKHPKKFNITQPGESPQVVVLTMDGKEHTESFSAPLYTPFLVVLKGNNPKHLVPNTEGGILANDIDIMAVTPDAIANLCAVILLQDSDKQVIWANHNDAGYNNKESFFVKRGDNCTFMVIANNPQIYEPGRLNVTELNNIEKNINYVYATAVIPKSSEQQNKIFINIIQSIHQTITVTTEDGVAHTEAFLCDIGTKYTAKIEVESDWYVAGQLNIPLTGEFKTNTIVRATPFVWNKFNVHIIQKPNQVLTVNIDNQTITNTRDIVVLVNTSWNASVKANEGYIAGSIIPGNSGVIVKETTITVSSAKEIPLPEYQVIDYVPRHNGHITDVTKEFISSREYAVVIFSWHYGSDERSSIWECPIVDVNTNKSWMSLDHKYSVPLGGDASTYKFQVNIMGGTTDPQYWPSTNEGTPIRLTKRKIYKVHAHSNNYKNRDYGYFIFQSPTIDSWCAAHQNLVWDRR